MRFKATVYQGSYSDVSIEPLPYDLSNSVNDGFASASQNDTRTLAEFIDEDFQEFHKCLYSAGQQMKDLHYFASEYVGGAALKFRERIYCYELYHQLRNVIGDDERYVLDGEMDKKSDPDFAGFEKIPDFIIHVPN